MSSGEQGARTIFLHVKELHHPGIHFGSISRADLKFLEIIISMREIKLYKWRHENGANSVGKLSNDIGCINSDNSEIKSYGLRKNWVNISMYFNNAFCKIDNK